MILDSMSTSTQMSLPVADHRGTCKIDSCSFCRLARGGSDEFGQRTGQLPLLDVQSGRDSLMVMMDSFPIGFEGGHVLVVPRKHLTSLAQFNDQETLFDTIQETADVIREMFPDHWLFTFEHGPGELAGEQVKCGGCHVDHAHGHILVLPKSIDFDDIRDLVEETLSGLDWNLEAQTEEGDFPMLGIAEFTGNQPYLQIGRLGEAPVSITYRQELNSTKIPSQLLRRIVATVAGKSAPIHWNWKIALQQNIVSRLERYQNEAVSFLTAFNSTQRSLIPA